MKPTDNALKVLEARYLARNEKGIVVETPDDLFKRVAAAVVGVERRWGTSVEEEIGIERDFFLMMKDGVFLPNTPTLVNAGRPLGQLSACFVLPITDCISNDVDGIYDTLTDQALIHKSGGGTGFDFSEIRPAGTHVASTTGVASGPVSFMRLYDASTDVVKQGGVRRGANMGILRVDHPDIIEFIRCKSNTGKITNFNISVACTDAFMQAVEDNNTYELIDPRTGEPAGKLRARDVWHEITMNAWETGEPGVWFVDEANRGNPVPHLGDYAATNPCAEQPLLPYDSCNLGSINLAKFVDSDGDFDWLGFSDTVRLGVRFLDNVIDANSYPLDNIEELAQEIRRVGLGVMGLADALIKMGIPYASDEALDFSAQVSERFRLAAHAESKSLAKLRGPFPQHENARPQWRNYRNCNVTTVAPTGSISIIAGCSGGIEPLFAVAFVRKQAGEVMFDVHPEFKRIGEEEGWMSEQLIRHILQVGTPTVKGVPKRIRELFRCANEIEPIWHLRHQAAWQEHIDSSISKTINLNEWAGPHHVEAAFMKAWRLKLKSVTVYRDGCRPGQVLSTGATGQDSCDQQPDTEETRESTPQGACETC